MKFIGLYITSFFSLIILLSCRKEGCDVIPESTVHISISQGSNINLSAEGNYAYFYGQGYAGVVLINNKGKLYAFDLCSTVNPTERNSVMIQDDAYFFDGKTGAKWLLDGSPAAVAECPLKSYLVTTSNEGFSYDVRY